MNDIAIQPLSDYELERGKPMPSKLHSFLTQRLTVLITNRFGKSFIVFPELSLETLGEKNMVPDIALCEPSPIDFSQDELRLKEPPLGVIEILSATQSLQTLVDKTNDYFSFGVKSCWVVLPILKSIYVFNAPQQFEVFTPGQELYDAQLEIKLSIDDIFSMG